MFKKLKRAALLLFLSPSLIVADSIKFDLLAIPAMTMASDMLLKEKTSTKLLTQTTVASCLAQIVNVVLYKIAFKKSKKYFDELKPTTSSTIHVIKGTHSLILALMVATNFAGQSFAEIKEFLKDRKLPQMSRQDRINFIIKNLLPYLRVIAKTNYETRLGYVYQIATQDYTPYFPQHSPVPEDDQSVFRSPNGANSTANPTGVRTLNLDSNQPIAGNFAFDRKNFDFDLEAGGYKVQSNTTSNDLTHQTNGSRSDSLPQVRGDDQQTPSFVDYGSRSWNPHVGL
jgi:hypothetical protein